MAPKYQVVMLATARSNQTPKIKDFIKGVAHQLWATGAVIADLKSWGSRPLAYRIRQHSINHYNALYLGMHLYCSPKALAGLLGAPCLPSREMPRLTRTADPTQRDYTTRT